jgi:hypothetical protein
MAKPQLVRPEEVTSGHHALPYTETYKDKDICQGLCNHDGLKHQCVYRLHTLKGQE